MKAIDMWAPVLPTPEIMGWIAEHFPPATLGYMRVFFKTSPTLEGVRDWARRAARPETEILETVAKAGIGRTLVTGFDEKTSAGETFVPNELVAELARRHPAELIPFAGVDVGRGMAGVRELERWVREHGFRGLSLRPFMIDLPADHRRYYPFYAKCVELGVPVSVHTSANWTTGRSSELGHPRHLDVVAADFPELRIILSHAGYPWVLEAVLLAWKHEHVYLELGAHRPRYFASPGSGWDALLRFGQTTIRHKVLFGTGWFLLGRDPGEVVAEYRALPIEPAVLDDWMGGNAARLLEES